jgi:hypothetical protein
MARPQLGLREIRIANIAGTRRKLEDGFHVLIHL